MVPRLTMREQIIIRISLRDDVPLSWPSCEDYSAPSPLPSKQRVAGSNPAGRASQQAGAHRHRGAARGSRLHPLDDLDLDTDSVTITRKGRHPATLDLSAKTCQALERYLRARSHHPLARRPELWLGEKARGPLTADGIRQMLDRRCDEAGIPHIHPHQFRHTAADYAMKSGMSDNDIMRNFGWKSRQMLARYAAANADERAREAHRRLSPGDRV